MEFNQLLDRLQEVRNENEERFDAPFINALSMREFGNKTHGDMLEIAFVELLNSPLFPDIGARHVGKERYRADGAEEDVLVWFLETPENTLDISLKAYGSGPLQLSTNSTGSMRELLGNQVGTNDNVSITEDIDVITEILESEPFNRFRTETNTIAAIYTEREFGINTLREMAEFDTDRMNKRTLQARLAEEGIDPFNRSFQIMSFNTDDAFSSVVRIAYELPVIGGQRVARPRWRFYDDDDVRIMEVRYGGADANALQRGLWTHTVNAIQYMTCITSEMEFGLAGNILNEIKRILLLRNEELD